MGEAKDLFNKLASLKSVQDTTKTAEQLLSQVADDAQVRIYREGTKEQVWQKSALQLARLIFQNCEFSLRFDQDRQIGICIFPYHQEILIGLTASDNFSGQRCGSCQPKVRQRPQRRSSILSTVIKYLHQPQQS